MIKAIRAFALFWYDFIVGDDWQVAVGIVVALAIILGLHTMHVAPVWWVIVAAVAILLPVSVRRAIRSG